VKIQLAIAQTRAEILRCQALVAEIYNGEYEVVFSDDVYDLGAKIEPWPHRYLMGVVNGELACAAGLYLHHTYVELFGDVTDADIRSLRDQAVPGSGEEKRPRREITKMVVRNGFRGHGLARMIMGSAHARDFLHPDGPAPDLLLSSKRSLVGSVHRRIGIQPRQIKPFPIYKVHEFYASPADPMASYLTVPEVDVPESWYARRIPGEYDVEHFGAEP
jgi:GNAT superfamily N-acetyltransferase